MKKSIVTNEEVLNTVEVPSTSVTIETPVVETPKEPESKITSVEDRLHKITDQKEEVKFRGKQRQIVYDSLKSSPVPLTIKDVSLIATENGLTAVGGVEPSVRYHLHHLTKDGYVEITNPTFLLT